MEAQNKIGIENAQLTIEPYDKVKVTQAHIVVAQPTDTLANHNLSNNPSRGGLYLGRHPNRIICRFCGHQVITVVEPFIGSGTHILALLICWVVSIASLIIPKISSIDNRGTNNTLDLLRLPSIRMQE